MAPSFPNICAAVGSKIGNSVNPVTVASLYSDRKRRKAAVVQSPGEFCLFVLSLQDETGNPGEEASTSHHFTASPDRGSDFFLNV